MVIIYSNISAFLLKSNRYICQLYIKYAIYLIHGDEIRDREATQGKIRGMILIAETGNYMADSTFIMNFSASFGEGNYLQT